MKINNLTSRLLLSFCSLMALYSFTPSANAQCIQADIGIQYNISGSKEPTERTNDVEFESHDSCHGNASVTTGVQGNVGGKGRVRQSRVVRHRFRDRPNRDPRSGFASGSTIQIKSNPAIDVYNPADNLSP